MVIRLKREILRGVFYLIIMVVTAACKKEDIGQVKAKAPLRNYVMTARLDNKQAGGDSPATGILKGSYSEKTKVFTYLLNYENVTPTLISINKKVKGVPGMIVLKLSEPEGSVSTSSLFGERTLSSLEERDLIKGAWFMTIGSVKYGAIEISGQITLKKN
jgi:hypothetical protein